MLTHIEKCLDNKRKSLYLCECGKQTIAFRDNVNSGHTKSCGCLRTKELKKRAKHGHRKNDGERTKVYRAWINMKSRCNNPNRKDAKNYIGRGIKYIDRWEKFENFLEDMGEPEKGMTLDRINNNLGYSKDNCRWTDTKTQNLNKRNNVRYCFNGQTLTLSEWSKINGIGRVTMLKRIQRNVPLEIALTHKGYLKL